MSSRVPPKPTHIDTAVPAGAPAWITGELIEDTLRTWQPYYEQPLTVMDALEILHHVGQLIVLLEKSK